MKTKQKAVRRVPSISQLPYLDPYLDVQQMDTTFETLKRKQPACQHTASNICNTNVSKKICQRQGALGDRNSLDTIQMSYKGQRPLPESHQGSNSLSGNPKSTANSITVSTDATYSPVVSSQCKFLISYLCIISYVIILIFTYR